MMKKNNIPFQQGVAIYMLSKIYPYSKEVRATDNGWVALVDWVVNNYHRFKQKLEEVENDKN